MLIELAIESQVLFTLVIEIYFITQKNASCIYLVIYSGSVN